MGVSKRTRNRELKKNLLAIGIIAVFAVAVFSINSVGRFIAQKVIQPIAGLAGIESAVTDTLTAEPLQVYIVSLSSFSQKAAAEEFLSAAELGNGYIFTTDDSFNVVYGCFNDKAVAEEAVNSLKESFTPVMTTIKTDTVKIKITGTHEQKQTVMGCFTALNDMLNVLLKATSYDITPIKLSAEISVAAEALARAQAELNGLNSRNSTVLAIDEMLSFGTYLVKALPQSNASDFLKQANYACTAFVHEYFLFLSGLE